ncbi:hypothetical protein ABZ703_05805 [Streptomyces massasporeus]
MKTYTSCEVACSDRWIKNVAITTGRVDTSSTRTLLRMAARAADTGALKVVPGEERGSRPLPGGLTKERGDGS